MFWREVSSPDDIGQKKPELIKPNWLKLPLFPRLPKAFFMIPLAGKGRYRDIPL